MIIQPDLGYEHYKDNVLIMIQMVLSVACPYFTGCTGCRGHKHARGKVYECGRHYLFNEEGQSKLRNDDGWYTALDTT